MIIITLRACPREDQAGVAHAISPISLKLGLVKGFTQKLHIDSSALEVFCEPTLQTADCIFLESRTHWFFNPYHGPYHGFRNYSLRMMAFKIYTACI